MRQQGSLARLRQAHKRLSGHLAVALLLLATWAAAGAGAAHAQPQTRADAPAQPGRTTLVVAAYPAVDQIVRAALPAWRLRHPDVDLRIVSRQFNDHHTAMTTALSTAVYLPDVMALEVGYVGRFAQGGGLDDLAGPAYGATRYADRFVPYAWQQGRGRGGAQVAMPADIGPGTLLYRSDVLARAGVDPAELVRSWDSYVAAGVRIKAGTGAYLLAHARDIKDVLIRIGVGPDEGLYFSADARVLVNTPRFVRAFELAREVRRHKLDARVTAWSNEWSEGLRSGRLASVLSGAWLAGHLSNWLAPATRGQWRAAQLPEGAWAAYGGTFYAIPRAATAAHKPLAWELIQLLTLERDRQLAAFKSHDAFPALLAAQDDPYFDEPLAFLGGQPARLGWREATRHITAVDVHKQDAFADEVINTELDKVLDQGKDIATALADAERLLQRRARR